MEKLKLPGEEVEETKGKDISLPTLLLLVKIREFYNKMRNVFSVTIYFRLSISGV